MSAGIAEMYLHHSGGDVAAFRAALEKRQRFGQAFFNALSPYNRHQLSGTPSDCFYNNSKVYDAIEYLLEVNS